MSSITSEITSAIGSLISSATPIVGVIDDGLKLGAEITKSIEQNTTLKNTPAMQQNVESQEIQKEKLRIQEEVAKNDLETDQKLTAI